MAKLLLVTLLLLPLVPLMLIAGALVANRPPLLQPPGLAQRLHSYFTTHVAQTAPDSPFPELRPRVYPVSAPRLYQAAVTACRTLGWTLATADEEGSATLHAVVTTPLWRFLDDVEITVGDTGEDTSALNVRSVSRVGKGDLAANTRHLLDLVKAVEDTLGAEPLTRGTL